MNVTTYVETLHIMVLCCIFNNTKYKYIHRYHVKGYPTYSTYMTGVDKTRLPHTFNFTGLKICDPKQKYAVNFNFHLLFNEHDKVEASIGIKLPSLNVRCNAVYNYG